MGSKIPEFYMDLFEKVQFSVLLVNSKGSVIYSNPTFEKMFGYKKEEIFGKNFVGLNKFSPEIRDIFKKNGKRVLKGDIPGPLEFRAYKKDNSLNWVNMIFNLIQFDGESLIQIIIQDINERKQAEKTLQDSEKQYRRLIENMNDGLSVVNEEGIFTYVNDRLCEMLGYSQNEMIGKRWQFFFDKENRNIVKSHLSKRERGRKSSYEAAWIKSDGQKIFTIISGQAISDEDGKYKGAFAVITDITERKQAEEKLNESEKMFKTIAEQSIMGIIIVQEGYLKYANETMAKIFQITVQEMINWPKNEFLKWIHPEDFSPIVEYIKEIETREVIISKPNFFKIKLKSGVVKWLEMYSNNISYQGKPAGLIIVIDITESKKNEQKLMEYEAKYRFVTENIDDIISILDKDLKIEYVNEIQQRLMGYSMNELIGKPVIEFLHPEDIEPILKIYQKALKVGYGGGEFRMRHKDGVYIHFEVYGKIIFDENNEPKTIITSRDITQRKKLEEELIASEERWHSLVENAPNSIMIVDRDGIIQYINRSIPPIAIEEIIGKSVYEYIQTNYHAIYRETAENVFKTGKSGNYEVEVTLPDRTIWYDTRVGPIKVKGEIIAVTLISTDITERVQAIEELRKSEEKYRTFMETANDLMHIKDQNGYITYINEKTIKTLGYTKEELIGMNITQLLNEKTLEVYKTYIEELISKGEINIELTWLTKEKKEIFGHIKVVAIYSDGKFIGSRGIFRDLTDWKKMEQQLRESEAKYRLIAENANDLILIINKKAEIEFINEETAQKLVGFSFTELAGRRGFKFLHPDDLEIATKTFKECLETGEAMYEVRSQKSDGTYIWIEFKGTKFIDKDGEVKILAIARDINERKQAEQNLKESEEKFKMLAEQSLMGILIHQDGVIKYINEAASKISEYSVQEMMEWTPYYFYKLIHPDDAALVKEWAKKKQIGEPGAIEHFYYKIFSKSGKMKWLSQYSKSISYQGRIADLITIIDISKRKEAERKLRESEEHFKTISEQSLMGICIIQDDLIKYLNQEYADLFGYSIEEMLNWQPLELMKTIHPEDKKKFIKHIKRKEFPENDSSSEYSFRGIKKTGEIIWLNNYYKIIKYRGKSANLIMVTDITAKIEVEENLRKSEKEYREAYKRAEFYKDLLSHDVSNILQSIIFSAESGLLILDDKEKLRIKLNDIKDQIKRSGKIVSNVRKLSKLEKGPPLLNQVDVLDYINKSIDVIQRGAINKKVNVILDIKHQEIYVKANEFLRDVFENILDNAVKYNHNILIEIIIRIAEEEKNGIDYIKLEFIDNGVGIRDISKKSIFNKGEREDGGVSGQGLGLWLAMRIIKSYNGHIWIENRVEGDYTKGSNFIVLIPKA